MSCGAFGERKAKISELPMLKLRLSFLCFSHDWTSTMILLLSKDGGVLDFLDSRYYFFNLFVSPVYFCVLGFCSFFMNNRTSDTSRSYLFNKGPQVTKNQISKVNDFAINLYVGSLSNNNKGISNCPFLYQ